MSTKSEPRRVACEFEGCMFSAEVEWHGALTHIRDQRGECPRVKAVAAAGGLATCPEWARAVEAQTRG